MSLVVKRDASRRLSAAEEREKREKLQARVGLASNVVGLGAGGAAIVATSKNPAIWRPTPAGGPKVLVDPGNAGPVTSRLLGGRNRALIRAGAIGALGLQIANSAGDLVTNRVLARESKKESKVRKASDVESMADIYSSPARSTDHGRALVAKAYRRVDPEADRQRRIGMYTGVGLGGGIVLGDQARRRLSVGELKSGGRGIGFKAGKARTGALLTAAALGSTGAGIAAYRHGVSARNQPWT